MKGSTPPAKRPGVRTLQSLEDLRRLQAKLLKAFLSGELDEKTYRASVYGCLGLAQTMKSIAEKPVSVGENPFGVTLLSGVLLGTGGGTTYEELEEQEQ